MRTLPDYTSTGQPGQIVYRFDVPIPKNCIKCTHYLRPYIETHIGAPYETGVFCMARGFACTRVGNEIKVEELFNCDMREPN